MPPLPTDDGPAVEACYRTQGQKGHKGEGDAENGDSPGEGETTGPYITLQDVEVCLQRGRALVRRVGCIGVGRRAIAIATCGTACLHPAAAHTRNRAPGSFHGGPPAAVLATCFIIIITPPFVAAAQHRRRVVIVV